MMLPPSSLICCPATICFCSPVFVMTVKLGGVPGVLILFCLTMASQSVVFEVLIVRKLLLRNVFIAAKFLIILIWF